MSITTLNPHTALVLIDLENGSIAPPTLDPAADIVSRAASLAGAFHIHQHRGDRQHCGHPDGARHTGTT